MRCLGAPHQAESGGSRQRGRAELLRVIELDPHEVGVSSANWTTELLGSVFRSAHRDPGHRGDGARVFACPWLRLQTPNLDLTTQSGRASGLRGKRLRVEVVLAGATAPEPLPVRDLVEADLWSQRAFRCAAPSGAAPASRSLLAG